MEDRLLQLAAVVGPLRRLLAAIAARLAQLRAFEQLGYARLSDFARERVGLSARQLQELARVHGALAQLPGLEQALVRNRLPWSKVRLVARVATPDDELAWIEQAERLSTRLLAERVRECSAGEEHDGPRIPVDRVSVRCTPAVAEKWHVVRELAERVAGCRLTAGAALEWVLAEAVSLLPAEAPAPPESPGDPAGSARPGAAPPQPSSDPEPGAGGSAGRHAPSPCREILRLAEGLADADAFEVERRLRQAVKLEQSLDAAIGPLLRVLRSPDHERRHAWRPLRDLAREELGMSERKARALLRIERIGDLCPEFRDTYRSGRLSWAKALCLARLLQLDIDGRWRVAWVRWATRVTVRRLAEDVERALLLRAGHHRAWQRCKERPERAREPIPEGERQMCAPGLDADETRVLAWRLPRELARWFAAVRARWRARIEAVRGRVCTTGEVFEHLLDHALWSWTRGEPGRRPPSPIVERDGYRCVAPGCTSRSNLQDHHVRFRSAGGSNAPGNRVTLCAFHHLRGVHDHRLRVRGTAPDELIFELGLRPGLPPLERYGSGDVRLAPRDEETDMSA